MKNEQATRPDVIIIDIDMPDMNGINGIKVIRQNFMAIQVLMLTVFDDDEKVFTAIKGGAGGYILKRSNLKIYSTQFRKCTMAVHICRRALQEKS